MKKTKAMLIISVITALILCVGWFGFRANYHSFQAAAVITLICGMVGAQHIKENKEN